MGSMSRRQLLAGAPATIAALSMLPQSLAASPENVSVEKRAWVHPGIFQRASDIEFMKEQVRNGRSPWKDAWDRMMARPTSAMEFEPKPVTHVVRGSFGAGQIGDRELNESIDAAESHLLQWIVFGGEEHARKVASILDAWSLTLADFAANDAMLLGGWTGGKWANIGELLRHSWPKWPAESQRHFTTMLRTVYVPLLVDFFPEANGNWDGAIMHSLLAIAIFCEDRDLFERVVRHYRFGRCNSGITRYVFPNGQCEETTRDQGHVQLGLGYFALTSLIAWNQGVDLFGEADNRLALGFEYTSQYLMGESVFAYGTISSMARDRLGDWFEVPLQHFQYDRGISMPYTEKAANKARSRSHSVLTMFRGQTRVAGRSPAPSASKIAFEAGASIMAQQFVKESIAPGQSIQEAVDHAHPGDVIQLAAGHHVLEDTLHLPSGVSLEGVGRDTILQLDPKKSGYTVASTDLELHDVTLRNLLIEAGTLAEPSRDQNQDRRPLATQLPLGRGGIAFVTDTGKRLRHLRLEHVTVRNATMSGIEIFGAQDVNVLNCDLAYNGGAVAPGTGKHHCLKLTHVRDIRISGSRLTDSFHGCGAAIAFGQNIVIEDCEIARNTRDGVQLAECSDGTVRTCVLEGNGGPGIGQPVLMNRNTAISANNNIEQNNGTDSAGYDAGF